MFVGEELSPNEGFIHAVVTFAETVLVVAPFIQWSPAFLRPCFLFLLTAFNSTKDLYIPSYPSFSGLKYLVPN